MPSGPKKRKAAKKKKLKDSNNSNSSSTTHSHGESDGGELNSPMAQDQNNNQLPFVEVKKQEERLCHNESLKVRSTEKAANVEEGNIGIMDKKLKIEEEMRMVPDLNKSLLLEHTSVMNGSALKDNSLTSSSVVVETSLVENGAANGTASTCPESETLQYFDKKPLVACGPKGAMRTTSWKGCCGILELLSSSDS